MTDDKGKEGHCPTCGMSMAHSVVADRAALAAYDRMVERLRAVETERDRLRAFWFKVRGLRVSAHSKVQDALDYLEPELSDIASPSSQPTAQGSPPQPGERCPKVIASAAGQLRCVLHAGHIPFHSYDCQETHERQRHLGKCLHCDAALPVEPPEPEQPAEVKGCNSYYDGQHQWQHWSVAADTCVCGAKKPAPPHIPPALPGAVQALEARLIAALRKAAADGQREMPTSGCRAAEILLGYVADELERSRGK